MGLYYVLLNAWARIFGYSETSLRSLTVLLGGLAVPVIVLLGTRLFGRPAGLVSGLLLALSPFFVQYEQTARSYALVVLLAALSCYFFVCELEQPSRRTRVAYVLSSALAIYAHYFAVYVLVVQLLTLAAVKRRAALSREWLATAAAIVVLRLPEAAAAIRQGIGQPHVDSSTELGLPAKPALPPRGQRRIGSRASDPRLLCGGPRGDRPPSLAHGVRDSVVACARPARLRDLEARATDAHPLLPDRCPAGAVLACGRRSRGTARPGNQDGRFAPARRAGGSWALPLVYAAEHGGLPRGSALQSLVTSGPRDGIIYYPAYTAGGFAYYDRRADGTVPFGSALRSIRS